MPTAPNDLEHLVRMDHRLGELLFSRLDSTVSNRHGVLAQLVFDLSLHGGAAQAVLFPAVRKYVDDGDLAIDDVQERLDRITTSLTVVADDEVDDDVVDEELANINAELSVIVPCVDDELLPALRAAVGDDEMVALGEQFTTAKRRSPTRAHPHAPTQPTLSKLGGLFARFLDRTRDAWSAHDVYAATDVSGLLDPQAQDVIDAMATLGPRPIEILEPSQARRQPTVADGVRRLLELRDEPVAEVPIASVEDRTIAGPGGGVEVRIYDPGDTGHAPSPVIVYVHGGGWVLADLDVYDASARALAAGTGAIVVSVEYRHAPEHPFPAAHDDVLAATRWVRAEAASFGGDGTRVAIAGESAGGNMAASTTIALRDAGEEMPVAQVLIYPVTSPSTVWASFDEALDARPLDTAMMGWFTAHTFTDPAQTTDPRFDLLGQSLERMVGLPPTMVITAERDPLRDQGAAYAEALAEAGVRVDHRDFEGVPHEFFGMAAVVDRAVEAQAAAATFLGDALDAR